MSKSFDELVSKATSCGTKKLAVAVAQDDAVLEAVKIAKERGIADSILVGDKEKIEAVAAEMNMDLTGFEIIDEPDVAQAALTAVKLVHDKKSRYSFKRSSRHKVILKECIK